MSRCRRFEFRTGRLQIQRDEDGQLIEKKDGRLLVKQKGVDMMLGIDIARLATTKQELLEKCKREKRIRN